MFGCIWICIYVLTALQGLIITTFHCFQKEEIKSYEEHVKKLLEMTPPKGKDFLHKVEHILEREKNWVRMFLMSLSLS